MTNAGLQARHACTQHTQATAPPTPPTQRQQKLNNRCSGMCANPAPRPSGVVKEARRKHRPTHAPYAGVLVEHNLDAVLPPKLLLHPALQHKAQEVLQADQPATFVRSKAGKQQSDSSGNKHPGSMQWFKSSGNKHFVQRSRRSNAGRCGIPQREQQQRHKSTGRGNPSGRTCGSSWLGLSPGS